MTDRLAGLGGIGRKLLVPFLTAGYPDRDSAGRLLAGLPAAGADAIELGVPFSDPLADGPVIAAASERALAGGMSLSGAIDLGAEHAGDERPPLILFTYLNPVAAMGAGAMAGRCRAAGFAGVLIADLPFDEEPDVERALAERELPLIRLGAPTTPASRLRELAREARGFIYLIARTGVTGSGSGADARLERQIAVVREETELPIVIGFGIADADSAARAAALADGVVVGSAFIDRIGRDGPDAALEWLAGLRAALDRG